MPHFLKTKLANKCIKYFLGIGYFAITLNCLGFLLIGAKCNAQDQTPPEMATSNQTAISIRAHDKWVGFLSPNTLQYAALEYNKPTAKIFKQTSLTPDEQVILERFLNVRKILDNKEENQKVSKEQLEIISNSKLDENKLPKDIDIQDLSKKSVHISLWHNNEFYELLLGTTKEARAKWPPNISSFLKLLYSPSSRAAKVETEGVGFTVPLDKPKEIGDPISWATTIRASAYTFEKIEEQTLKSLPQNIQNMILYSGYIVPLSTNDLKTMSKLNWDEHPEDVSARIGSKAPPVIWWGLVDYKGKSYGINAWETAKTGQ